MQLGAQEREAVVELTLTGIGATVDAHRAIDAGLRLRPGVAGIDRAAELSAAAGESVEGMTLGLDPAVRGNARGGRRGTGLWWGACAAGVDPTRVRRWALVGSRG